MKEISFVQRPKVYAVEVMSYDHSSMVFAPCNEYWRQLKKISVEELLSTKHIQSFVSIREEEVWDLLEFISASQGSLIHLGDMIFTLTNNVVSWAASGKRCKDQHDFTSLVGEAVCLAEGFNTADPYPSLTFIHAMSGIKAALLESIVKETLKIHPVPLLPREAREACEISGYTIPAKVEVLINIYAIGRDPKIWKDLEDFRPERFEGCSIDFKGNSFQLLTFGGGRRICPGISFANSSIELELPQLLYHCDWTLPNGVKREDLDMTKNFRITSRSKNNLHIIATTEIPFLTCIMEFCSVGMFFGKAQ